MRSKCVKVRRELCSKVIEVLSRAGLMRKELKFKSNGEYVKIPVMLSDERRLTRVLSYVQWEICEDDFEVSARGLTYKDLLRGSLPDNIIEELPRSYYIIGDIAVIHLPEELTRYGSEIAEAIMKVAKNVKAVYATTGIVGDYRLMNLIHLGGERRTWTIHKEYGINIYVDVGKAYFNPSLSEEHRRVATKVRENEVVIDLFAGVGPFALHILTSVRCRVYVVDINEHAINCFLKSIELNRKRIIGEYVAIIGDALKFVDVVKDSCVDRVIMNLPHKALEYIPKVIEKVKVNGVLHVYCIASDREEAASKVLASAKGRGDVEEVVKVLDYAPFKYIYRVDLVRKST